MKKLILTLFLFGLILNSFGQIDITKRKVTLDSLKARNDSIYVLSPITGEKAHFDSVFAKNIKNSQWDVISGGIGYSNGNIEIDNGAVIVDSLKFYGGEKISWNTDRYTLNVPSGLGCTNQVGQELNILVYNNSGSTIGNGVAVYPNGAYNGTSTIGLGQSNTHETIGADYGLTTISTDNNNYGCVVWFGEAHDLNTSSYNLGDQVWISATSAGEITNVMPEFPNYAIQIGIVTKVGTSDGIIFVTSRSKVEDNFTNFWNGVFRETFDFFVTESAGTITGTLTPTNGHPDMTMIFSDGLTMLDTDPGATITLTAGTDINPQVNYVYIPKSTKVLTVSTSGWLAAEHIKVAQILLQSSTATGNNGALRNQNWNDALESTSTFQGHLSHITERIRQDDAKWNSGIEATGTVITASTPDDVWVSTTEGEVYQMHKQTFTAKNTQTGDSIIIVNNNSTPYLRVNNLNTQLLDASGNSLNSTSFSFVLWGVNNKTSEPSHLMINLPSNSYAFTSPAKAISDANHYSVYSIPKNFQGVGFLIARFTYTYKNDVWTLEDTENLRGYSPNTTAGGGAGGVGITSFLGLSDTESSYTAYEFQVANAGATALESPSVLTLNDSLKLSSGNLVVNDTVKVGGRIGIGTSTPVTDLDVDGSIKSLDIFSKKFYVTMAGDTTALGTWKYYTNTDFLIWQVKESGGWVTVQKLIR